MACKAACSFAKRPAYEHLVSTGSLQLIETHPIPGDREFDHKQRYLCSDIVQNLRENRGAWCSERSSELETAAVSSSCRKLFQLIRLTCKKKSDVGETFCGDDGMPINNI